MATTTTPDTGELRLALDDILVGDNVRDIDQGNIYNLARSIAVRTARGGDRLADERSR